MSRPELPIDWREADELLMCGCPGTEIAAYFGMHCETFYDRVVKKFGIGFSEYAAQKKAVGEAVLRKHQYHKALGITKKGDNTLLIWLGKQRLGQKENHGEIIVNQDVMKAYEQLMSQIEAAQKERKEETVGPAIASNVSSLDTNTLTTFKPLNAPAQPDDKQRLSVFE